MSHVRSHSKGFTLIELMIVVVVLGVLAGIAYPSYQNGVITSRRGAATACLLEMSQFMERYYTTEATYEGGVPPALTCRTDLARFYTFDLSVAGTATAYTVRATPTTVQRDTRCGTLTLNQSGGRTASGTEPGECW